jgi:hypothetical protein
MAPQAADHSLWFQRWQRFSATTLRAFHAYANWLVGITWRRFIVLAVLLFVSVQILKQLPPFHWSVTETIEDAVPMHRAKPPRAPKAPKAAAAPVAPAAPAPKTAKPEHAAHAASASEGVDINIQIDDNGIRITPRGKAASAAAPASGAASVGENGISITMPANIDKEAVRQAVQEARDAIREAVQDQKDAARDAAQAARDAAQAAREQAQAARDAAAADDDDDGEIVASPGGRIRRVREVEWGDFLSELAMLWIAASAIVKATYKGRIQAEVKAAQAEETAEAESLKRQVVEARMAAMQAQVEPHFLFNTLASIDHLIETDPPRASLMQKNLIALLRASMPTMREASDGGVRDLGRELAVIRPYLEILKVRMEERLVTEIDVPEGLQSAEFPPMMVQTLVENAIKHGLEPKAEGGTLKVKAEILHGKLAVSVADTGLGFGRAATAGTGVGLANIRERLQLLYDNRASLTVAENQPSGTRVTITVPYKPVQGAGT